MNTKLERRAPVCGVGRDVVRRSLTLLHPARERYLVVGEMIVAHVRGGVVDPAILGADREAYVPIGRLFGGGYVRKR
jgi:hypothetical protein